MHNAEYEEHSAGGLHVYRLTLTLKLIKKKRNDTFFESYGTSYTNALQETLQHVAPVLVTGLEMRRRPPSAASKRQASQPSENCHASRA